MACDSQKIEAGKYKLCLDIYWECHSQLLLELKSDKTYKFTYRDDTQKKRTYGKWKIETNYLVLTTETDKYADFSETWKKILIQNGEMVVKYKVDENEELITGIFEKIE